MTRFETWFIKKVLQREVVQSHRHAGNIRNFYKMIGDACENEFIEDNTSTLNAFLKEQFDATQKQDIHERCAW